MMKDLSQYIVTKLIAYGIVNESEKNIYCYGYEFLFNKIIIVMIAILVGYILNIISEITVFLISFGGLRQYTGGIHMRTPCRCMLFSVLFVLISGLILKFLLPMFFLKEMLALWGICIYIILKIAPISTLNKKLDQLEYLVYRKRMIIVIIIEVLFSVVMYILNKKMIMLTVSISNIFVDITLMAGRIVYYRTKIINPDS